MVRTVVLALALALGGGAPYLGSVADLLQSMWTTDQVDAGGHFDPNGATTTTTGSGAEGDLGGMADPNGAETDAGNHFDPNG
ncbi:MAG TPA: hypothetical protein VEW48_03535 [Thermoanaerobaculia bacterium]|nr:hypothetical protein [Thermoanaerobaculia bacterium]